MLLRHFLLAVSLLLTITPGHTQAIQAAGSLMRAGNILDFYEAAIANPAQVALLSLKVKERFYGVQTRYKDLSNELAQKFGWFDAGPFGLEYIELRPEPSPAYQYGFYSITLKKLKSTQCEVLSNDSGVNGNFLRIELNGSPVFVRDTPMKPVVECKSQWFFQDGQNELKYVAG